MLNLVLLPLVLLGLWTGWQQRYDLPELLKRSELRLLLLILAGTLFLTPWLSEPGRHLYGWLMQLAGGMGLYLLLRLRLQAGGLQSAQVVTSLLSGACGICLLGWVQYANLGLEARLLPLPPSDGLWSFYLVDWIMIPVQHAHYRVYSLFYAPPMFGVYLVLLLPLALAQLQLSKRSLLWGTLLVLMSVMLVLSLTRIAWLAALLAIGVYLWGQGTGRQLTALGVSTVGILGLALLWPPIAHDVLVRLQTLTELEHHSSAGRLEIWLSCWELIKTRWLTGYGLLNFWQILPEYRWRWPHAHSLFLQQLLEYGLWLTAAWYVWLAGLLRHVPRRPLAWACACSLLAWLVCGWADDPAYEPRNRLLFWVIAALLSHERTVRNSASQETAGLSV